jgi:hypothetical protein
MTNTEFMARSKSEGGNLLRATPTRLRPMDGLIIVAVLAAFLGLIFLLSK